MAANINWLLNEFYTNNKVIIWGANTHVAKKIDSKEPKWMGKWLSNVHKDNYFSIAFEKGATNENFIWTTTSYKYFNSSYEKYNLIIYLDKLTKIKPVEWITTCD